MSYASRIFGGWGERQAMYQAAEEVGGEVAVLRPDAPPSVQPLLVQLPFRHTMLTLDLVSYDENPVRSCHRLRAPFHNAGGHVFRLRRATVFDRIARLLGFLPVQVVGSAPFDRRFVIRSASNMDVRRLFDDGRSRSIVFGLPDVELEIDDGGWRMEPLPTGVAILQCVIPAVDEARPLVRLFELFQRLLPRLTRDDRPGDDEVARHIRTLRGPGGIIREEGIVLWRGEEALQEAATALAELGDGRAVGALVTALQRGDPTLRARAAEALGRIGDPRAIRPLVRMLGQDGAYDGRPLRIWARDALDALGEGALADAVLETLKGRRERLPRGMGEYRGEVVGALVEALRSASGHHAAAALAELDAVEALAEMREALRIVGEGSPRGEALAAAIRELEARAALPRPAESPETARDRLPRPAGEPEAGPASLPRPAEGEADDS